MTDLISKIIAGKTVHKVPAWLMRQAGRYLPEYREQFAKKGDFLALCYDPDCAATITMQPLKRFDMDAAIVFSDILLLPQALGCDLKFVPEIGPIIKPVDQHFIGNRDFLEKLEPVFETMKRVKQTISPGKTLIGFAGAPWTVLAYMLEGKSSGGFMVAKTFAYTHKKAFNRMINLITEATIAYLQKQMTSGADVVQLFDSWSGVLSVEEFYEWVIYPTKRIVDAIGNVIGFPKGAGILYKDYAELTGVKVLSLDYSVPLEWARDNLQQHAILQGNLNPMLLAYDIDSAIEELKRIFLIIGNQPFIFNLGHGILKQTPVENVERLFFEIRKLNDSR